MQTTLTVSLIHLQSALHCVPSGKGDYRHYLNGVNIIGDNFYTWIQSTDGSVAYVAREETPHSFSGSFNIIIPSGDLKLALKTLPRGQDKVEITFDELTCSIGNVTAKLIEGVFPNIDRIIPKTLSGEAGVYNPHSLAKIAKALGVDKKGALNLCQNGKDAAIANDLTNNRLCLIAPAINHNFYLSVPNWAHDNRILPTKQTEAAA